MISIPEALLDSIFLIQLIAFQLCLLGTGIIRTNVISLVYLVGFISNLQQFLTTNGSDPSVALWKRYFFIPKVGLIFIVGIYSFWMSVLQIVMQIVFNATKYENPSWLKNFGVRDFRNENGWIIFESLFPDATITVLSISLLVFFSLNRYLKDDTVVVEEEEEKEKPEVHLEDCTHDSFKPVIRREKQVVLCLLLLLAASFYPCIIASAFFMMYVASLLFFMLNLRFSEKIMYIMVTTLSAATGMVIFLIQVSRLDYLNNLRSNWVWSLFGFSDFKHEDNMYFIIGFYFAVIILYILSSLFVNQYHLDVSLAKNPDYLKRMNNRSNSDITVIVGSIQRTISRFCTYFFFHYGPDVLFGWLSVIVIVIPGVLSITWMIVLCIGLLLPRKIVWILNFTFIFALVQSILHYVFNFPGLFDSFTPETQDTFSRIGLRAENDIRSLVFGSYNILLLLHVVTMNSRISKNTLETPISPKSPLLEESNSKTYGGVEDTDTRYTVNPNSQIEEENLPEIEDLPIEDDVKSPLMENFQIRMGQSVILLKIALKIVFENSFYLTLILLYFADLTYGRSDIFHSIFLGFVLIFFIFPKFAKKCWIFLIITLQFTILSLYVMNTYFYDFPTGRTQVVLELIGFYSFSHTRPTPLIFFREMIWYFIILYLSVLSLRAIKVGGTIGKEFENLTIPPLIERLKNYFIIIFSETSFFISMVAVGILICTSKGISVIVILFTIIFFINLSVSAIFPKFIHIVWWLLVVYSALAFLTVYVFQFTLLNDFVDEKLSEIDDTDRWYLTMDQLGLEKFTNRALSLLPYVVVFLLSVLQLWQFQKEKVATNHLSQNSIQHSKFFLNLSFFSIRLKIFFQRVVILHSHKILLVTLFVIAQLNPNCFGLVYLGLVLIVNPIPFLLYILWIGIALCAQVFILSEFLFQFNYFEKEFKCEDESTAIICKIFDFVGFQFLGPKHLFFVSWDHFLVLLSSLLISISLRWEKQLRKENQYEQGKLFLSIECSSSDDGILSSLKKFIKFLMNDYLKVVGYEMSLLFLLITTMLLRQYLWGLLYLVFFGICIILGKRRMRRVLFLWICIFVGTEAILFLFFVIRMNPFPWYDWSSHLNHPVFRYIKFKNFDSDAGVFAVLYCLLFCMTFQTKQFWRDRHKTYPKSGFASIREMQVKLKKLHVWTPPPQDKVDYTLYNKQHPLIYLFIYCLYNYTRYVVLFLIFVEGVTSQSIIRLVQIAIVIVYLTWDDLLIWKIRGMWAFLGSFYFAILFLEFVYFIPAQITNIDINTSTSTVMTILRIIGIGEQQTNPIFMAMLRHFVIILYYIQTKLYESTGYIFYTNSYYCIDQTRFIKYIYNRTFRAGKILENSQKQLYALQRRKKNLDILRHEEQEFSSLPGKKLLMMYRENFDAYEKDEEIEGPLSIAKKKIRRSLKSQQRILDDLDENYIENLLNQCAHEFHQAKTEKLSSHDEGHIHKPMEDQSSDKTAPLTKSQKLKSICIWLIIKVLAFFNKITMKVTNFLIPYLLVCDVDDRPFVQKIEKEQVERLEKENQQQDESTDQVENPIEQSGEEIQEVLSPLENVLMSDDEHATELLSQEYEPIDSHTSNGSEMTQLYSDLSSSLSRLVLTLKLLHYSYTDILCYLMMILIFIINPSIWNMIFPMVALGFAVLSFPTPYRLYWYVSIAYTIIQILYQYVSFLIQKYMRLISEDTPYTSLAVLGWRPFQPLILDVILYLGLILTIIYHKNVLQARGDWLDQRRLKSVIQDTDIISLDDDASQASQKKANLSFDQSALPIIKEKFARLVHRCLQFYKRLVSQKTATIGKDYYVPMLLSDAISVIIFALSYQVFTGRGTDSIQEITAGANVSIEYVLILIALFIIIVIDRIIYLLRNVLLKLIYLYVLIVLYVSVYIYLHDRIESESIQSYSFFYSPIVVLRCIFLMKFIYLWFSSLQVQSGYSVLSRNQEYLMKVGYSYYAWNGFRSIPFLFEMKTLLDWSFTTTSLQFVHWLKLEDIRATLFRRKNAMEDEKNHPRKVGSPTPKSEKCLNGILWFVGLSALIFFPLIFFSNYSFALSQNYVKRVDITVGIDGWQEMYENQVRILRKGSNQFSWGKYSKLHAERRDFRDFANEPFQIFKFNANSDVFWTLSPPGRQSLIVALNDTRFDLNMTLRYTFHRFGPAGHQTISNDHALPMSEDSRKKLVEMLELKTNVSAISFPFAFNNYFINKDQSIQLPSLKTKYYPNCTLQSVIENVNQPEYWRFECKSEEVNLESFYDGGPYIVIQSTKIVSSKGFFGFLSGLGLIAFYTGFLGAIGRFIRRDYVELVIQIPTSDLPDVDLIWQFLQDIYIARSAKHLELEKLMFERLIEMFQDPGLLAKWTKPKHKAD